MASTTISNVKGELKQYMSNGNYSLTPDQLRDILSRNIPMEKPKRAPSAFLLWKSDNKEMIKAQIPEGSNGRGVMASKGGEIWGQLLDSEKQSYIDKSNNLKEIYLADMRKYKEVVVIEKPKGKRGRPSLTDEEKAIRKAKREEKKSSVSSVENDTEIATENKTTHETSVDEQYEEVHDVKVEEFTYDGKEYLLDSNSGELFDIETEDIIGKKVGDKVVLF